MCRKWVDGGREKEKGGEMVLAAPGGSWVWCHSMQLLPNTHTLPVGVCAYVCVCVRLCLVFLYRNLLPTGSNTELCHSVKHFSWCTQKENYNLHGVWKRKGSAARHEDSWYPTEDVIFSCAAEALCVFSKKYWPQKTSAGGNAGLSVSEWKGLRWECGHIEVSGCAIVYVSIYEFGGLSKFPIQ